MKGKSCLPDSLSLFLVCWSGLDLVELVFPIMTSKFVDSTNQQSKLSLSPEKDAMYRLWSLFPKWYIITFTYDIYIELGTVV